MESFDEVVVQIDFTPSFVLESLCRFRSLGVMRKVFWISKYLAILVCGLIALLMIVNGVIVGVIFWALVAAFLALSGAIDRWWTKRSLLRSPFINERLKLRFSNAGLCATSPSQDIKLAWSVFTKMVRLDDGFLLMQGPGMFNWIPNTAIVGEKEVDQLAQLLSSKIETSEDRRTHR